MVDVYIRVYKAAMTSGLMRKLGDRLWRTLCVLALHMNDNGECYPTQEKIADALGIHRQQANARIKELLEFRFEGQPVVEIVPKPRRNLTYRVLPVAQFAIFDGEVQPLEVSGKPDIKKEVSGKADTYMSGKADINLSGKPDTNYNHNNNNHINNNHINNINTGDEPSKPLPVEELKNASDVVKYFCKKYREAYGIPYNPNFSRDASMVKNKLVKSYSMTQIKSIIDLTFEQYDRNWATQVYPRPTVGQLCTWIPNKALAVLQAREKKQSDIKKTMEKPTPTAEDIIAELERGLG